MFAQVGLLFAVILKPYTLSLGNELRDGFMLIYGNNEQVRSRMDGGSSLRRLQLVRQPLIASFPTSCRWAVSQTTLLTALESPFICGFHFSQFCAVL